jgi:hypothetical protein
MIKLDYIIAFMLIGGIIFKSLIFCYYAYKILDKSIKSKYLSCVILIKTTFSNSNSHQVLLKKIGRLPQEKGLNKSNNRKNNTQYCQLCGTIRKEKDRFCSYCSSENM